MTLAAALREIATGKPRERAAAAARLGSPETLSGRADPEAPASESEVARAVEALRRALADPDGEVRYEAAFSLSALGDRDAVPLLVEHLEDGNARARQAAAIALGRLKDRRALEPLRAALRAGPPDVRYQAAMSLAEIAPVEVFDDLTAAVEDEDAEVREAVAAALGEIGEPRGAGWLGGLLDDPRADTRFEAAFALARVGDRRAVPALLGFLTDRRRALEALEALLLIPDDRAREPLRELLGRFWGSPVAKVRAAAVLAELGDAEGRRYLCDRLLRRGRLDVKGMTVHVLADIAGPWARDALVRFRAAPESEPFRETVDLALARVEGKPA